MAEIRVPKKPAPKHLLVIPTTRTIEIPLRWGADLLLFPNGAAMSGALFHALRGELGATILSDQPEKVCRALGVPIGEPGITRFERRP